MTCFKRQFNFIILLTLSFALSACIPKTQERPDGTGSGGANFTVSAVSGGIVASKNVGEFPLPGERTYNFKACLIDFTRKTNISNAKFVVKEINKELTTDAQGCLNWPETIKYNYLSDSIWLKITRTFTATGLQRGTQEIHFAINPWSHGENLTDVLDLAKQSTPYLVEDDSEVQARLAGQNKTRTIWVENGELNATNGKMQGDAYAWHDQIFLKPQIQFSKTDATPVLIPITAGSFKAEVSLVSEDIQNQKVTRITWAKQVVAKATITNGTLMIDVDFSLKKGPTSGQTLLALKLTPIGAMEGLLPFEGVFPLGGPRAFTQSASLKISQTVATENSKGQFSINKFMNSVAAGVSGASASVPGSKNVNSKDINSTTSESDANHSESAGIHVDHFHISDFKIANEQGQTKTLSYRNQTCLTNTVGNFGLANRAFKVDTLNEKGNVIDSKTVTSDVSSCLYWEARTEQFDLNECRHYLSTSIRIQNADLGMNQTENILINPWLNKGVDLREAADKQQYATTCENKKGLSQADNIIAMRSMTLTRLLYRPQVLDRTLQLSQKAVFGIDIADAGILDFSNETSGLITTAKPFTAGKYLLRLAFVRTANPRPDNGYVTHADVILDSSNGALTGKMELNIKDLQATMIRKTVLAQIFPIDIEKYNSKVWVNNDPDMDSLIDKKTKLVSPVYASEAVSFAAPGRITFAQKADGIPSLAENITKGFKMNPSSSTLIHDIVVAGEAAQAAMIKKNAFNEADGKVWTKWSQEQNLELTWLSDAPSVQNLKNQFALTGDAKASLQNLITMDKLDIKWAKQFCTVLLRDTYKKLQKTKDFDVYFMGYCLSEIEDNPNLFVKKSAVYRVLTMKPAQIRPQTLAVSNLSVSSSFGYSKGHSQVDGTQSSLSLSAGVNGTAGFASAGLGASYGAVQMITDDQNRHSGNDVASSMNLNVTKWQMDIPVTSYNQCTILRVDPNAILSKANFALFEPSTWDIGKIALRNRLDLSQLFKPNMIPNPLFKGWLICSDIVTTKNIMLPETYHMISQGNGDTETFDSIDELNRRFLLPLRGTSDMARFKATLVQSLNYPANGEMTDEVKSDLAAKISPLMKRMDPAPGMILYDPQFQEPQTSSVEGAWGF